MTEDVRKKLAGLIEDFNVYLGELLLAAGNENNVPMRMTLTEWVKNQQIAAIRRMTSVPDPELLGKMVQAGLVTQEAVDQGTVMVVKVPTEAATLELIRTLVAKFNLIQTTAGESPIFTMEDLFTEEVVNSIGEALTSHWKNTDNPTPETLRGAIASIINANIESAKEKARQLNFECEAEPLIYANVGMFCETLDQFDVIGKVLSSAAWAEVRKAVSDNEDTPHSALMAVVEKHELAIIDRSSVWNAKWDLRYLAYALEHMVKSKHRAVPAPKLVL